MQALTVDERFRRVGLAIEGRGEIVWRLDSDSRGAFEESERRWIELAIARSVEESHGRRGDESRMDGEIIDKHVPARGPDADAPRRYSTGRSINRVDRERLRLRGAVLPEPRADRRRVAGVIRLDQE